jgi:hypothetical protein
VLRPNASCWVQAYGYDAYDKAWNLNYRTNNALVERFNANAANGLTSVSRGNTLTIAGKTLYGQLFRPTVPRFDGL